MCLCVIHQNLSQTKIAITQSILKLQFLHGSRSGGGGWGQVEEDNDDEDNNDEYDDNDKVDDNIFFLLSEAKQKMLSEAMQTPA